jgi:hypothetical protein
LSDFETSLDTKTDLWEEGEEDFTKWSKGLDRRHPSSSEREHIIESYSRRASGEDDD